jgi:hypothetical protein
VSYGKHRVCVVLLGLLVACDPVQDAAIAALGGEAAGVREGPTHRPGQPCLLCHDGAFGDPPAFSVAGTVFQDRTTKQAAVNAVVKLEAADGAKRELTANAVGNFYLTPDAWSPTYPLQVSVTYQSETVSMTSVIGGDGSCAGCHVDPSGPDSPGHVYAIAPDAGAPP